MKKKKVVAVNSDIPTRVRYLMGVDQFKGFEYNKKDAWKYSNEEWQEILSNFEDYEESLLEYIQSDPIAINNNPFRLNSYSYGNWQDTKQTFR